MLFFHAAVPGFSGGYVGVDVFYVISGYLITSLIARDEALARFSLISFYERRIRRIFPALFAVVFFSLLAAAILFDPTAFRDFGKSLVAVTLFVSNILFKRVGGTGGYFAATSSSQALLHTWSLSVEEQFYLFFPTAFILLLRWAKKRTAAYLAFAAATSFIINIWATAHRPLSAFYIFVPRAWELLLGSLLAIEAIPVLRRRFAREIAGLGGLVLIACSVSLFTKDTPFPGFAALAPVAGAVLIIYAGENGASSIKLILSFPPLVSIGVVSYSLYLWHWPILVFSKNLFGGTLKPVETAAALALSVLLAFVSYHFIESPFRGGDSPVTRKQIFTLGVATSVLSAFLGLAIYFTHGFPGRFDSPTRQLISENVEREADYEWDACSNWKRPIHSIADINFCEMGPASSKKVIFWGDSHVQQLYPLVRQIYDSGTLDKHGVLFAVNEGCKPAEHLNRSEPGFYCDSFSHFAFMRAKEADVDTVYIGFEAANHADWDFCPSVDGQCIATLSSENVIHRFLDELSWHVRTLRMLRKRVIVSLPFPVFDRSIPDLEIRNLVLRRFGLVPALAAAQISPLALRNEIASIAENDGAYIFDPRKSLCRNQDCITGAAGVSIYKDNSHIARSQIDVLEANMRSTLQVAMSAEDGQ